MMVIHVYINIYCNIMEEISHMKIKNQINRLYYTYTIYIQYKIYSRNLHNLIFELLIENSFPKFNRCQPRKEYNQFFIWYFNAFWSITGNVNSLFNLSTVCIPNSTNERIGNLLMTGFVYLFSVWWCEIVMIIRNGIF